MTIPGPVIESLSVAFWSSLIAGGVLAYPIYRLLLLTKSRQTVSEFAPPTHQAKQGTPTMGGLILVAAFTITTAVLSNGGFIPISPGILALFLGFAFIGFTDDFLVPRWLKGKRGLGWKQKIMLQILVAGWAAYAHGGNVFDARWGLTVFLILFAANAFNFIDGLDALAGSVLLAFCSGLAVLCFAGLMVPEPAIVCAALMGGVIPFLFLNAPPAKVFMGDVGSLPVGAVLGLGIATLLAPRSQAAGLEANSDMSILAQFEAQMQIEGILWRPEMAIPLTILCLLMVVELVPVPLQIAWVKLFKKRLFPFTPIHHAFEKAGWPESRVVWMFALIQIVLAALAVLAYTSLPFESALRAGGGR